MSLSIAIPYLIFVTVAILLLWRLPLRQAALIAYLLGIILLPVADYPAWTISPQDFTVEVIGGVLPSYLGWTKVALVPPILLALVSIRQPRQWLELRFAWLDAAILLFCLWPLAGAIVGRVAMADALRSAMLLSSVWAGHWLLAKLILTGPDAGRALTRAVAWSGVMLLPFALLESPAPAWIYEAIYQQHPFQTGSVTRAIGFRPIGFFEHGNQYGIWMAMAALAWIARLRAHVDRPGFEIICAVLVNIAAIASQSGGAIVLWIAGAIWMSLSHKTIRRVAFVALPLTALLGLVYVSGSLPVSRAAWDKTIGPVAKSMLQNGAPGYALTRARSFGYRIRRDQMALPVIAQTPLVGHGTWDWWRSIGSHPWGLPLLLAGQFGIISLLLCGFAMVGGAMREILRGSRSFLPIMVLLSGADALLNSYIFLPAILAAAVLSQKTAKRETAVQPEAGQPMIYNGLPLGSSV